MKIWLSILFLTFIPIQPASAQDIKILEGFKTPSGNIHCLAWKDGVTNKVTLRCDMQQNKAKVPPKPATCEFDWGNYFAMKSIGKASRQCVSDTVIGNYKTLPYGKKWSVPGAFSCNVTQSRLRCANTSNRGFELAIERQRIF